MLKSSPSLAVNNLKIKPSFANQIDKDNDLS